MTDSRINEMRNILIYAPDGVSVEDTLKNVKGWSFEELGIPEGHKFCLRNGDTTIAIFKSAENIVMTSNVLPHDLDHNKDKANEALLKLKAALDESDIQSVVTASDKDLGKA